MTVPESLRRLLTVDPLDAGCAQTFAVLHRYAERVLAGDAERAFPDVAVHLRSCPPCAGDLHGLLTLIEERG